MPAFVIFEAASRRLAIPASRVLQVLRAAAPAAVAGAPEIVRGVLDIHGSVVPVLDVRVKLGAAPAGIRPSDQLIVVDAPSCVALLVDRVVDVRDVADADVDRDVLRGATAELAEGALRLPEGAIVIQSADRWAALAEVLPEAAAR